MQVPSWLNKHSFVNHYTRLPPLPHLSNPPHPLHYTMDSVVCIPYVSNLLRSLKGLDSSSIT